ncbi:MAG TPA: S9 family peptidase [Thermoanaerobaculia bacterium]|jgi:dipeptidyl aminopeptidase/acylaminoacyl peptidase
MPTLVLACCLLAAVTAEAKRALTVDDQFRIVTPADPMLSPDGRWVLYALDSMDAEKNARHRTYRLRATNGDDERELLREGDGSPMWSPDSRSLFFVRGGQLFEQPLSGGDAVQRSHIEGEKPWSWQLARDGKSLLAIRSDDKSDAPGAASDVTFVDEGSNAQTRYAWDNLYRFDLASGALTRVTQRQWSIDSADLSPDGTRAVVAARPDNGRNTRWKMELFVIDLASGAVRQLTHNRAPESTPRWSPDGTWILFNAVLLDRWELGNGDFWRVDAQSGATRLLTPKRVGRFGGTPTFSADGKSIFTPGGYGTARYPVRVDVATGAVTPLVETAGTSILGSLSADTRTFVTIDSDAATSPQVWLTSEGAPRRAVTSLNGWLRDEIALGTMTRVSWKSEDGKSIEGLLLLPAAESGAQKPYPLIAHVACGPGCAWTNTFQSKPQVYAGLGYAQLFPNVRGATNYDDAFMRANRFDIGGGDRRDILTGVDAMVARGIADREKLAIDGWSYGGVLGGYILTKTQRFKAATLGAMVSDWITDYGSVVYYPSERWFLGGTPWSQPEVWRERSSLTHADKVTTPTLLHHGDDDTTCDPVQSLNYFVALRRFGTKSRLIRYPGEGHDLRQPAHLRLRDRQDVAWIEWFVRGVKTAGMDDGPWELRPVTDESVRVR